jgi:DNA-binding CsgD family transcriptional regulator
MVRRSISDEQRLSQVLERIHQVPFGEASWGSVLAEIADFLGAQCADLTFSDPVLQQLTRWEQARIDPETVQEYTTVYMGCDWTEVQPRVPVALQMRQGQVVADSDFWDSAQRRQMMFFQEYYHPLVECGECVMGCVQIADDKPWVYLTPHFRSRGPQQQQVRDRVQMLLPHVRRALDAESRLQTLRREQDVLDEVLDQVADAVVLLDRNARIVRANRAAEKALRNLSGLQTTSGSRLTLSTSEARAALSKALAQCANPLMWTPGAGVMPPVQIVVPRAQGAPIVLTVQPLSREAVHAVDAIALMFISDPEARPADRSAMLRKLYKLSYGEAELMQALASGERLKEFASRREVTYETARSLLRNVFQKTGARRQAELVQLVLRGR